VGLALFEFFAHWPSKRLTVRGTCLALALAFFIGACLRYLQGKRYQDLYQDYRALAEGLRVQLFWRLTGIDASVANYYLCKHRTELDWIRNALRNWNIPLARPEHCRRFDLALEYWVKDQHEYFHRRQDDATSRRDNPWVNTCLCIAAGA